jgi:hypothetical protein
MTCSDFCHCYHCWTARKDLLRRRFANASEAQPPAPSPNPQPSAGVASPALSAGKNKALPALVGMAVVAAGFVRGVVGAVEAVCAVVSFCVSIFGSE